MTQLIVEKSERLPILIQMRTEGKSLDDMAARVGVSRGWVCNLLKKAGVPVPKITYDKRGSPRTKHGMRRSPIYWTWYSMKTRCGNPNHADYPYWGGKGITYDPRWECFLNFLEDMGDRPSKEYTLDRIDNTKGYYKENCRWLLKRLQNRNMSSNVLKPEQVLEIRAQIADGARQVDVARKYGIKPSHVGSIVKRHCWKDL